jgi:Spy/CpxP family protein refolding chaperone
MKQSLAAIAALTLLLLQTPARGDELPPPIAAVATILELAPQQIEALITMVQSRDADMRPLGEEMRKHQDALGKLVESENADPAAIGQTLLEIHSLQKKAESIARQAAAQFEQVLSAEQREKLSHIRESAPVCNVIPAFQAVGLL